MRLSMVDAVLYAAMVGLGEVYFVADAVRLGATPLELGLVVTLPLCVGAVGPLIALALLSKLRRRRPIVAAAAFGQASVLCALSVADGTGRLTPPLLIALAAVYQMFGQSAGSVWSSWYGDLVPRQVRGRYFARRSRGAHFATFAGVVAAGATLQAVEPGAAGDVATGAGGLGFAAIFGAAAVFRFVSAALLTASHEPTMLPMASASQTLADLRAPSGLVVRRVIGIVFALQLVVYVSSPYFSPFMLEHLRFSYAEYTAATMAVVAVKWLTLGSWGHVIDRFGARPAYALAVMLVALVPLPWLLANGIGVVLAAEALSGFAWGGHEVSQFSLVLERSDARIRPQLFAAINVAAGTAQLLGGLAGGLILAAVDHRFRLVFAASMIGRLCVGALIPALLPATTARDRIGRRSLLIRIIGFRPSGGVALRPLVVDPDDDADATR